MMLHWTIATSVTLCCLTKLSAGFNPLHLRDIVTVPISFTSKMGENFEENDDSQIRILDNKSSRRNLLIRSTRALTCIATTIPVVTFATDPVMAALQDSLDIDTFLRTGVDAGGNMGVSSQAGKSRPQTGVVFRDGSDVFQDSRTGTVSAELLTGTKSNPSAVMVRFDCPSYKLETGSVFDVECRDASTGDGVFVAVTERITNMPRDISDVSTSVFLDRLFGPTGRFSFYGPPTDIKIKKDWVVDSKRYMEISFSNLSQSTQAEIPRKALLVATIPSGTENAILLVGSASASRWKKAGVEETIRKTASTFEAIPAPKTNLKLRPKDRTNGRGLGDFV